MLLGGNSSARLPASRLLRHSTREYNLPFLYCTSTILQSHSSQYLARHRHSLQSDEWSASHQKRGKHLPQRAEALNHSSSIRQTVCPDNTQSTTTLSEQGTKKSLPSRRIDGLSSLSPATQNVRPGPTESTLTWGERSVFERIYKDILEEASPELRAQQQEESASLEDDELEAFSEHESLESIFQNAVSSTGRLDPANTQLASHFRGKGAKAALFEVPAPQHGSENRTTALKDKKELIAVGVSTQDQFSNAATTNQQTVEGKVVQQRQIIEESRNSDATAFDELLATTQSDLDVWHVLQNHVFAKMHKFADATLRDTYIPEKNHSKQPKYNNKLKKLQKNPPTPWQQDGATVQLLSILRANYAPQCVACLHNLRTRFPRSPYILMILPKIKSLGSISYVLGASTELYNELLFILWREYRDLSGCAKLVEEMLDHSVAINARTRAVFKDAERYRAQAFELWSKKSSLLERDSGLDAISTGRDSELAPTEVATMTLTAAAWWQLHGTESGFEKWQAAEERALDENRREQERLAALDILRTTEKEDDDAEDESEQGEPDIEVIGQSYQNDMRIPVASC